jgi:general secretion pathway protein L
MSQTVILFWQDNADEFIWQFTNDDNTLTMHQSSLEKIAQTVNLETNAYKLIIVISSTQCFFTQVKVPAGADNKIMAGLPFLIEEKLTDEPENFHITCLTKIDAERWNIVAIERDWLAQVIQQCRQVGLEPDVVVPLILLLPYYENQLTLAMTKRNALIRYHRTLGMELEKNDFLLLVDMLAADSTIPRETILLCEKDDEKNLTETLAEKGFVLKEIKEIKNWAQFFANAAKSSPYNLLQQTFTPKRKYTKETKLYKIAGLLMVAWVSLTVVGKIGQYFYFKHKYETTQVEIEKSYKEIFPDVTRVVSPKTSLQRELDKLTDAKRSGSFLTLITEFGNVTSKFPAAQIESLDFKNSMVTTTLKVDNFTVLKEIGQKLEQDGFTVKQENAVSQNNKVQARLILQKGNR